MSNLSESLNMWDLFSENYSKSQKNPSVFAFTLLNLLRIDQVDSILDAGCGAGFLHPYIIQKKKRSCEFYALDFSAEMIKRAKARVLDVFLRSNYFHLAISKDRFDGDGNNKLLQLLNYRPIIGSVTDLKYIQDSSIDVYFSNLCFQLIDQNQENIYREALRVLKVGGKLGFSVWGRRENCAALTLITDSLINTNLIKATPHTGYVNDTKEFMNYIEQFGFKIENCWNQSSVFDIYSYEDLGVYMNAETRDFINQLDVVALQIFKQEVNKLINVKLQNKEPLGFECVMVIARKIQ